jgi:F-type H+-transporting ATPase subunit epsilon
MATPQTGFHCVVVTPERVVLDTAAEFAALPAWDGEIGILRARAPLMVKLGIGVLRVKTAEGEKRMAIDGGFAEMVDNKLSVLTERAHFAEDLKRAEVEQALAAAKALEAHDLAAVDARNKAIARAKAQLKLL